MYDSRTLSSRLVRGYRWWKTADLPEDYQVLLQQLLCEYLEDYECALPRYVRSTLQPLSRFRNALLVVKRSWLAEDHATMSEYVKLFEAGADFPPLVHSASGLEDGYHRGNALLRLGWQHYYVIEMNDLAAISRGRVRIPKRYNAPRKRSSARRQRPVSHAVH